MARLASAIVLVATGGYPTQAPEPAAGRDWPFRDAAAGAGLVFHHDNGSSGYYYFAEIMGGGGAFLDYDNDGDLDVYLVQGGPLGSRPDADATPPAGDRLYRNDLEILPDGSRVLRFTDVTERSGIRSTGYGMGVASGDYDDDGWVDLYVANFGSNALLRNNGDGTFADVTSRAAADDSRWSTAAAFVDYDRDGRLDLFVGNYVDYEIASHKLCYNLAGSADYCSPRSFAPVTDRLLRNRGDGSFHDVSLASGVGREPANTLGVATADFDGDGWIDLYVANDLDANRLWLNSRGEAFHDAALLAGCALEGDGTLGASMGVEAADFDGDGDEDLFVTHLRDQTNTLYLSQAPAIFRDASAESGLGTPSWPYTGFGTAALDLENDGRLDLFVANGAVTILPALASAGDPFPFREPNQLFRNLGGGRFEEIGGSPCGHPTECHASRGVASGDVDNDGDTDLLVVSNNGPVQLLVNDGDDRHHWLGLRLIGGGGGDMPGTRLAIRRKDAPALWRSIHTDGSYASASDPRISVGLGPSALPSTVRVEWSNGAVSEWVELAPDRCHTLPLGSRAGGLPRAGE